MAALPSPGAGTGRGLTPAPPPPPQVFSIVVFGSIVNEGYLNSPSESEEFCIYNRNPNACGYGVTVGVLAFLTCLLYLALDVYFPQISSVKDRKKAVLSDIGVSGEPPSQWAPPNPSTTESAGGCPGRGPAHPHAHLGGSCHSSPYFPDGETEVQAGEGTDLGSQGWQQGRVGPGLGLRPQNSPQLMRGGEHNDQRSPLFFQWPLLAPSLVEPREK